jgi:hypothetical protein
VVVDWAKAMNMAGALAAILSIVEAMGILIQNLIQVMPLAMLTT